MVATLTQLPIPTHFNRTNSQVQDYHVSDVYALQVQAQNWARLHGLKSAKLDHKRVSLLVIDQQDDFNFPSGSLFVSGQSGTGSMDDAANLSDFIYRNLGHISEIIPTMDSHLKYQVFFPSAHVQSDGLSPAPYTTVTPDDYRSGKYRANPLMATFLGADETWLTRQFLHYTEELEKTGRLALTLWPYHCLIGSHGHKLSGVVNEAIMFHSFARGARNNPAIKGGNELTEHYSIFQPEVQTLWDGRRIPGVQKNVELLEMLTTGSDYVVVAGEAGSHCLLWTLLDLVDYCKSQANARSLINKIYVLQDCTSSVVVPGVVDYTDNMNDAFNDLKNEGVNFVESTTQMDQWPRMIL